MGLSVMATPVPLDLLPPQFRKREEQEQPSNAVPLDLLPSDLKPQPEEQPSNVVPLDLLPSQLRSREVEPTTRPTARELPIPSAEPEESSFIRQVLDVPLGVAKGAATGFRMIADAFGAGSGVSEAIKSSEKYLEGLMSAQSRNDSAEISRIMQDAEDKGFGDQVRAAIQAFTIAPIDLVSQALGTSAPMLLGGVATAVLRGGATAASKVAAATAASRVATGLGGAQGAGLIKGNIYDAVKEEMLKAGDSPALAEEKAQQAQAYGGKNLDQILLGTALGAFAGRTGVEKLILNKIAGKEAAEQSLLRRTGEGAVTEAAPEFVQAAQEAAATNIALQREGFDVPTMRGVVGQATLEGLAGSALGATTGALSKPRVAADTAEDKAIAALDKLAADEEAEELKLEESILARANEIVSEFSDAGQTISMDDAYERARFELVEDKSQAATSGLVGEEDLFAEEAAAAIPPQETIPTTTAAAIPPQETIPATPEELKKIDKDLRKKLGRAPIFEETEAALNDFEQEKTRRLRAESGGRGPTVPVLSGEEAVSGVTRAPERVEPTGLGRAVEPTDVSGARKEPTLGAIEPKDQINTAKEMMADISKQPLNVENVSGKIIGGVKSYKGFKFYKVQEGSETFWKVQSPENQALNRIGNGDTSHGNSALAKDMIGENLDNKFDAETFARRLLPKLTEGKATPTAPEPTRFKTAEDLSPEDRTAFNSETAEIRASMKEATDAAKERGLPFANAAAPFVDQLRALDQSYGIGKPISEKRTVAQLAAELGGTADEDSGFRPARDEEEEEFGERQGELKSDKAQMLRILSGSMYGSGIQDVAVKELLQNAFDSVKEAVHKGVIKGFGKINITFDEENRRIIVTDNGMGMTTKIVDEGFFTVGGTKKDVPPELRSGGYGIAKVAFMTSTEEISLDTVRDGVRNIVKNATPVQITEGDFKIKKEPAPKDEHGTTVVVDIPSTYVDRSGKEQRIYFFSESSYISPLKKPLIGPVEVTVTSIDTDGSSSTETLPVGINFDLKSTPLLTKVNFEWGSADIYYGVERKDSPNHIVLSSGVYQFDGTGRSYNFVLGPGEIIPYDIIINVKPNVDASSSDYPFTLEREKFRDSHKQDIEALTRYLAQVARGAEAEGLQDTFKNIISMPKVYVGGINPDTEEKLRKLFNKTGKRPEFKPFETPKEINVGAGKVTTTKGVVLIDTDKKSEREKEGTFAAEKEAPKMEQFMNQMGQDPRQPIFHNNTNIDYIAIGEPYGDPQAFFAQLGSLFIDMKETVANGMYRYAKLKLPNLVFTGISIDKTYGGLNIIVPFKGSMINPFYVNFGETTLTGARERILDTMIHELAHTDERAHGVGHNSEMMKIKIFLSDSGKYDVYRDKLLELLVKHESTFSAMKEAYDRSTTKNAAKSLEDYNKATPSRADGVDVGVSKDTLRTLSAREGPGGDGDLRSASESDRGVTVGAGISESDADAELEQLATQLNLKVGDIHPTMVSAIANNDLNGALLIASQKLSGFSAELAKKLLDLKLPTNISFNNGRDLVRRSIDDMSAPQQQRLFRYVEMHYPQVYDKYFKNYDRSESLETVAEGLIELQKPNYKLGPVIAEFDTVSGAYKEHIKGLTSPGAYYPRYDEIVLNTNTLSGKSYRVFLHEVVHAATEYALNTYGTNPQSLTPGQRESVEELTKMYNYALKEIGSAPYGMTNIYEFISEVFTNKKFQELLKGIKYKSDKPTFLSKLIKAIFKAVGFDNLASNAMVEATNIFSAVRSQTTVDRGPRFAKSGPKTARVKGPISSTWRSVEDVTKSLIQVFNDGLKGRSDWESVLKDIKDSMWDTSTGTYRRAILGFANLRQIDDLTKTKFPQISAAIRMIEQMLAYRGNIMKTAEDITKKWTKAKIKNLKQDILMSRIMIEATIRGIDPDRPGVKPVNAALVQAWNQLEPEFKEIYREVRDFYKASVENMVKEMKLKIAKSTMTLTEKKKALREIKDKFGPDKLVQPYFPLRRFGKYWFQVGKGNFKEFYEFEDQFSRELSMRRRIAKLRQGNAQQQALADTVRKGNGLSELFSQNRTSAGIIQDVQAIVDSVGGTQLKPTQAQYNITEKLLKKQLGRTPTVDEVEKRFEQDKIKQELKDSLNQMLYILLPQQSMRKMFINRKAVQGASSDMLRVFATSAVHSAYQQSRFKYAESFLNNLTTAIDYVEEFADRDRAAMYREYISEVEKRAKTILSNEDTSLAARAAGRASELTFFYMLSAPFSAMLNVLGVAQVTMPYIGGRYGYAKTNALMIKNFGRYFATMPSRTIAPLATGSIMQAQFPSIVEGGKLTGILKRAADRFIEEGQINISLTNDLMDMGERPSELYTGRYNMVKKMLSGLFHQSERLGREVSLLTTFELAYDKLSKSPKKDLRGVIERDAQGNPVMNTPEEAFELAITEAKDIVGLSLGDFTRQMKPRYFTPPLLSVITKFKQYSVLATYAVVRNFYFTVAAPFRKAEIEEFRQQMIKDKMSPKVIEQRLAEAEAQRKELYQEGRRRLAGILGITYLLGGNEASPFYSIGLGALIKMLANEDDDEFFDWENWLKNYMEEELGGAAGDMLAEMGMDPKTANKAGRFVGGSLQRGLVSELTGGDLATRVSLDPKNLWYREGRYSSDVRESIVEDIIANAGPVVGLGFNWIDSYRLFQEGQYQRAFEKAAPALVSKPVAAERIADEGARTASGIKLADNFSAWELSMLSIGLQPTRLAQAQKSAIEAKQYAEKVKARRATLLNRLWMERNNVEGFNETLERIIEFNNKYPGQHISPDNAMESFERRAENQAIAETIGGQFDKKSIPEALQMLRYGRE
jgi:hypothetical protein